VYKELRLYPNTSPNPCDTNNKGAMYNNATDNQVYVCNGSSWKTLGGFWAATGNDIYNTNSAEVKLMGNLDLNNKLLKNAKIQYWYYTAGNTLLKSDNAEIATFDGVKSISIPYSIVQGPKSSTFTISCIVRRPGANRACTVSIYKNGSSLVRRLCAARDSDSSPITCTRDVGGWRPGDTIELWGDTACTRPGDCTCYVSKFEVKGALNWETVSLSSPPEW